MTWTLSALLAAALGGLALVACDAAAPPEAADERPVDAPEEPFELPEPTAPAALSPAQSAAAQAIAETMGEQDAYARARGLATLLPTLGGDGLPGVQAALQDPTYQPTRGGTEIELLVRFWARHEPAEATRWAVDRAPHGYRLSAVFPSLSEWAASDPSSAAAASHRWEVDRADLRELVQIALVHGWFERDPAELARYLEQHEMGLARQRKIAQYARLLLQHQGTEAALRWAEAAPTSDAVFKQNVYRQLASALVPHDLEEALRFCETHCDGPYGSDLRYVIALRWSRRPDGNGALEWLARLPDGPERNGALRNALSTWAKLYPAEATAWMRARVPAGADGAELEPWLQVLFSSFALALIRDSPAEAIAWAERVADEEERRRLLVRVARAWRFQDEAAAEAWLTRSPLSDVELENARKPPPLADRPRPR